MTPHDVRAQQDGETPLFFAAARCRLDLAKALLAKEARAGHRNKVNKRVADSAVRLPS